MKKALILSLSLVLALGTILPTAAVEIGGSSGAAKGALVIVGGALGSSNAAVYNQFITLAGGKETARIGIIPAASGNLKSSKAFEKDLEEKYGLKAENVEILEIAVVDDKKTPDVDESKWIANAESNALAAKVKNLTGIWFVGGDQTRITKALLRNGMDSVVLTAIRGMYAQGGVIGGTSAGAAIMSDPMIAGGSSLGAIRTGFTDTYGDENDQLAGPLYMEKGLGFFTAGLVDQHFDQKARLGRLAVAAYAYKAKSTLAFGVDENTAMIYKAASGTLEAAGAGGVTIVDVSGATQKDKGPKLEMGNVDLSFLSPGDVYTLADRKLKADPSKDSTKDYEYYSVKGPITNTGAFSGYSMVKPFIMYNLVDNSAVSEITSYCFDEKGQGVEILFSKTDKTEGYWGYQDGNLDSYSAAHVRMDLKPIQVEIKNK